MSLTIVLGANGLVGRKLLPLLRAAGVEAKSAGRSGTDRHFDWSDPSTFRAALTGAQALYLVPPAMIAFPAPQAGRLLAVAHEVGVRRVVAVSSLGVTFPTEPEGSGRHAFEKVVRASGIEWAVLRPSGFMQNFSEGFMLPAIRQAAVIVSAAGDGTVAMVDSGDIASIAAAALTRAELSERILEITGPEAIGFTQIAEMISAAAGRIVAYQAVGEPQMAQMMGAVGVPSDYAAILLGDQKAIRDGHAAVVTTTVRDVTGRNPVRFADFAQANAEVWR